MTFWELFFKDLNLFLGLVLLFTLIIGVFLAIVEPGSCSLLDYLSIFLFCFLLSLVACGVAKIAVTAWDYNNQTIVDISNASIRKTFSKTGLNCLLKPHDAYHRITSHGFNHSVIFKDNVLIFFSLDKHYPKQSLQLLEKACNADLASSNEQKFLQSVSKGGEK